MKNISVKLAIGKNNTHTVVNKGSLNTYGEILNNIKNIKNTCLDIYMDNGSKRKEVCVDIAKLSKELISKIRSLYTPEEISSYRVNTKNQAKSISLLGEAYKKIDDNILDWWKNEKIILPSSIIHRTIDNLYHNDKIIINKETKQNLFFLISKRFELNLDRNAVQSTMIQHLQNIPDVVKAIDNLGVSDKSYFKYEIYCLLAENIYNFFSGNENQVDFSEMKKMIKEVAQRETSFYPKCTLAFC